MKASVIIPAYNAKNTIAACLDAIKRGDYKGDYEIILVDDGSTDDTAEIASRFEGVRVIKQNNAGPASARNRGAKEAQGDIIIFTDSDCAPERDWMNQMLGPFDLDPDVVGVKGAYKSRQQELAARFVQLEYEDKYDYMKHDKYIDFIDTYSAAFKRPVFIEMNGYDTSFPVACAEDIELSYRISKKGYKMVFNPSAVVYHIHPNRLWQYLKKKYKFAYWRMLAIKKNPGKLVKDSHTPQTMKIQVLLPAAIIGSLAAGIIWTDMAYFAILLGMVFLITTVPFTIKAMAKDFIAGVLSPALLFMRAGAQFLGILGGVAYAMRKG